MMEIAVKMTEVYTYSFQYHWKDYWHYESNPYSTLELFASFLEIAEKITDFMLLNLRPKISNLLFVSENRSCLPQ